MTKVEIGGNRDERQEGFVQVDCYGEPEVRADIRALPFRNLERIYASHVLEHLPDADIIMALKSCRRALRADGVLELYVPDLLWLMRRFLKSESSGARWALWNRFLYGSQEDEGQFHRTGFSVKRLHTCLVAAGFRQVDARRRKRSRGYIIKEVRGQEEWGWTTGMEVHAVAVA